MPRASKTTRLSWLLVALLLALGCVTPQIPLPPPDIGIFEVGVIDPDQEMVTLSGKPNTQTRDARIIVENLRTESGVLQRAAADGSFTTRPFEARDGDEIQVQYQHGQDVSDPACIVVDYDRGLSPCR